MKGTNSLQLNSKECIMAGSYIKCIFIVVIFNKQKYFSINQQILYKDIIIIHHLEISKY